MKKLILLMMCSTVQASDLCLMLSPVEEAAISRAQEKAQGIGSGQTQKQISMRLDGIIYTHEKSWTIWINGRAIKSGQKVEGLRILKVTPDFIEAIWSPKPDEHYEIFLKPNEVFSQSNSFQEFEKG